VTDTVDLVEQLATAVAEAVRARRGAIEAAGAGSPRGGAEHSVFGGCVVRVKRLRIETDEARERFATASVHGGQCAVCGRTLGADEPVYIAQVLVQRKPLPAAGLDPSRYAGHSLRAGLATSAAAAGVEERAIMAQTGHKSVAVARRYIRDGSLFRGNAAAAVGL